MTVATPKISIVTPSYNQADYLNECLTSVKGQNQTAIEHLVFDGGSSDGSVEIIRTFEDTLAHWESGPDGGQTAAINKGLTRASGDILCWLNSDDGLMPGALAAVVENLPLDRPAWLVGRAEARSASGRRGRIRVPQEVSQRTFIRYKEFWLPQPSVFWNRAMHEQVGLLSESYNFVMDLDLFYRMFLITRPVITDQILSFYTVHPAAKTSADPAGVDAEFANWLSSQIDKQNVSRTDVLREFATVQRAQRTLREHVVISRVAKFWKRYINPDLWI